MDKPLYPQHTWERLPPSSAKRITLTVGGTLLLVLACNLFVIWYLDAYPVSRSDFIVEAKWALLQAQEEPLDWLILGDSAVNQGVMPSIIEQELGGRALNAATVADWTYIDSVWMLETHIEQLGPPVNVVLIHVFDVYPRTPEASVLAQAPLEAGFWDDYSVGPEVTPADQLVIYGTRVFPLFYKSTSLQRTVHSGFRSPRTLVDDPFTADLSSGGFMAVERNTSLLGLDERTELALQWVDRRPELVVSDINRESLRHLVALAETYEFNLYLFNTAYYEPLYTAPAFDAYYDQIRDLLARIAAQSSYIHYIDNTSVFGPGEMELPDHLTADAAQAYTYQLVDLLRAARDE